jgi:hypothetical protein
MICRKTSRSKQGIRRQNIELTVICAIRVRRGGRMPPVVSMLAATGPSEEAASDRVPSAGPSKRRELIRKRQFRSCKPGGVASPVAHVRWFPDRRVQIEIGGAAGERENEVRHFVSIAVAAVLLCAGSMAAKADYARAAREHRMFRAGFPPGWPSVCPRGYYARCSPFRCWCVVT